METMVAGARPGRLAQVLAVLSVACCWILPFSPLVAIGAVSLTKGSTGWPRRAALTGAALSSSFTLLLAVTMTCLVWQLH